MVKCPQCNGFKEITDIFRRFVLPCPLCMGKGKVANKHVLWIARGKKLRDFRLDVLGIGLREAARKFQVDASNLSKMERGIINPRNLYQGG